MKKKITNKKNDKNKEDFSGLVDFISGKFDDIDGRFNELGEMFRDLQGAVDSYAKRADAYFQEMVVLSHQMNRHEKWIKQLADKAGVKLHY